MNKERYLKVLDFFKNNMDIILVNIISLIIIAVSSSEIYLTGPFKIAIYCGVFLFILSATCQRIRKFSKEINNRCHIFADLYAQDSSKFAVVFDNKNKKIFASEGLKGILGLKLNDIDELLEHECFKGKINKGRPLRAFNIDLIGKKLKPIIDKIIFFECGNNKYKVFEFYKNSKKSYLIQALKILEKFELAAVVCNSDGTIVERNTVFLSYEIDVENLDIKEIQQEDSISFGEDKSYKVKILTLADNEDLLIVLSGKRKDSNEIWSFLQRSTLGAAIIDMDFKIHRLNKQFEVLTNYDKAPEGKDFFSFIEPEEKAKVATLAQERFENKPSGPIEIHIKSQEKYFLLHINKIEFDSKLNYIFSIIDTTKYKILEMNFVHSQKMQAVGQLAGAIAHDFNNLLTAMVGFCDLLLLRHPPGDRSFGELMQIKQNVNRAANLVRQLLAFSRKQVLQPNILEVTNIIADLSNLISRLIGENIDLQIEHGKDLDYVKVDQGQLEQVIINLAVNARDAMPNGGALRISTSNIIIDENFDEFAYYAPVGDEPIVYGDYVLIEISDSGCGIQKSVLDKIFEPFFSTKAIGAGTGLGLSTVYGIVKQTGGYIRLQTEENKGTKFFIFLKTTDQAVAIKAHDLEHSLIDDIPDKISSHNFNWIGKILVVEDENPVRIFSAHALTAKGYEVLEADCADTALSIMENEGEKIKMIITDVMMPGMTGPKMIEEIHKTYPTIKVIYISGYAEDALTNQAANNESFHFLPKPFTLKQLANKVKEVIAS